MLTIKKVGSPLFTSVPYCKLTKYFPSEVVLEILLIFAVLSENGLLVFTRENEFWRVVMYNNKSREIINEIQVTFRIPLSLLSIILYYSEFKSKD
jgi:hypothetical protein